MCAKSFFFLLFCSLPIFGQTQAGPNIVILSPNESKFEKSIEKEISDKVMDFKKGLDLQEANAFLNSAEFKQRPENVQLISRSEVDYLKTIDHISLTSYLAEQHLVYAIYEQLNQVVVQLSTTRSKGDKGNLDKIATAENAAFVLNFSALDFYAENKKHFARITVQLYEKTSGSILLNKTYKGDWDNPGFEYACEEKSVDCCINNVLLQLVPDVAGHILAANPTIRRQKQLAQERKAVLERHLEKAPDQKVLRAIIPASETTIETETAYQLIFNADQTKFVAFFLEPVPESDAKAFRTAKNDVNVNIVSDDQMGFFGGILPNTYAHIVKGVLYKGKWYYEKAEVTYFNADGLQEARMEFLNKLQDWNFFVEKSAELNPKFWEDSETGRTLATKSLFRKATTTDDPADKSYIGLNEIVADQLKKEAAGKAKK